MLRNTGVFLVSGKVNPTGTQAKLGFSYVLNITDRPLYLDPSSTSEKVNVIGAITWRLTSSRAAAVAAVGH